MDTDLEPPEAQALWRAAGRGGTAGRLFEADRRFQGYPWYDALPRVKDVRTDVAVRRRGPSARGLSGPARSAGSLR